MRYRLEQLGAQAAQGGVFGADADRENDPVEKAEDQGDLPQAEHQRQDRDLQYDDRVIGMVEEAVGPRPDERRSRLHDDARGPSVAGSRDDPDSGGLEQQGVSGLPVLLR